MVVAPEFETKFLTNLQRLLTEGSFVATYKYALLLALADLSVELGKDDAGSLRISTNQISEKFIEFYWRQASPFATTHAQSGLVLAQNTGKQAGVVRLVNEFQQQHAVVLTDGKHHIAWKKLVRDVDAIVRVMPLWKLQTVGQERFDFLYENVGQGTSIELRTGVMFCFRKYHGLISELIKGYWARFVRRFNLEALGAVVDLHEFLFGAERSSLADVVPVLLDIQGSNCFYCRAELKKGTIDVDHFIPWSRYPVDLGHNFVLAHKQCNGAKSDMLAAEEHLHRWAGIQKDHGAGLMNAFQERGIISELSVSLRVTQWAYAQTFQTNGMTWRRGKELAHLSEQWAETLRAE